MTPGSLTVELIKEALSGYTPQRLVVGDHRHAAVAIILKQVAANVEVLLIERAHRTGDPWSGQMAFPGGMVSGCDASSRAAAERETEEEIGILLTCDAYLGRIDDLQGRHRGHLSGIVVSAFVYAIDGREFLPRTNHEVCDVLWVPLTMFAENSRAVTVRYPLTPRRRFSGIQISDNPEQVVWGLTRRFLGSLFTVMGADVISPHD